MSDRRQKVEAWGHTAINLWERIYKILRGLPHHRLALISVGVGAAILAGPFWEPYLRATIEKAFAVKIDLPTEPIYGVVLIAMGLGYHLLMTWIASNENMASKSHNAQMEERIRAHDAPIFNSFIKEVPVNAFNNAMSSVINDHSYLSTQSTLYLGAFYFLDTITNRFNDTEVQEKADSLKDRLDKLANFISKHFSVYGPVLSNNVLRFCMEPQWNIDRGGNPSHQDSLEYNKLTNELTPMVRETIAAYDALVRIGHRRLL